MANHKVKIGKGGRCGKGRGEVFRFERSSLFLRKPKTRIKKTPKRKLSRKIPTFVAKRKPPMKGIVMRTTGLWCTVMDETSRQTYECRIRGNLRLRGIKSTNPVAVGDRV